MKRRRAVEAVAIEQGERGIAQAPPRARQAPRATTRHRETRMPTRHAARCTWGREGSRRFDKVQSRMPARNHDSSRDRERSGTRRREARRPTRRYSICAGLRPAPATAPPPLFELRRGLAGALAKAGRFARRVDSKHPAPRSPPSSLARTHGCRLSTSRPTISTARRSRGRGRRRGCGAASSRARGVRARPRRALGRGGGSDERIGAWDLGPRAWEGAGHWWLPLRPGRKPQITKWRNRRKRPARANRRAPARRHVPRP